MGTGKAPGASEAPGAWLSPVFSRPRLHPSTQLPQPQIAELDVWSARKRSFRIEASVRSSGDPPPQASPVPGSRASGLQRRVPLSLLLLQPQFSDPLRRVGSGSLVVPDPLSLCPASCVLCLESRSPVSGLPSSVSSRPPLHSSTHLLQPQIAEVDVWSARKRSFWVEAKLRSSRDPPSQASPVPGSRASGLQSRFPLVPARGEPPVFGLPSSVFPRSPASRVAMTLRPRAHVSNQRLENSDLSVTRLLPCQHTIVSPEGDAGCQLDFGFPLPGLPRTERSPIERKA